MKRIACVLLALLALAAPAGAQSITVPGKVTVDQPGLVVIRATALDADSVRWYSLGPGLQTFPADVVEPKAGTYLGFALQAGTYRIGVVCAKAVNGKAVMSAPSVVVVTVGTPTPPPPVTPADALAAAVQAAYGADADPQKATYAAQLAAAYQYGLDHLAECKTLNALFLLVRGKAPTAGLVAERQAIGAALNAVLSDPNAPADPAVITPLFQRVIAALKGAH